MSWRGRSAARAALPARRPRYRPARQSTIPAPRRSPRWWTGRKRQSRASSIRFQIMDNSICYSSQAVATMNENTAVLLSQERLKSGEQRVFPVEHIVEGSHRNRVGAVLAQEAAERVKL